MSTYETLRAALVRTWGDGSDLLTESTPQANAILRATGARNVTREHSPHLGREVYRVPFAYSPFWSA